MIHVAEMDKQHANNSVCVGSIGHETLVKDLRIVTVYPDQIEKWGLHFYPDINQEFYYVNPINPNLYIGMNDYFEYLRSERVSELQQIAYDLGATYFCVRIKEQKKTKRKNTVDVKLNAKYAKKAEKIENNYSKDENEVSEEEAYAKLSFKGHSPEEPQLYYFKHDPQIKRLIEMRMDSRNELTEQQIILKCSHSSGIKEKDALSIDAAFSALKVTNKTSFTTEAQNEVRQVFEYTIRF